MSRFEKLRPTAAVQAVSAEDVTAAEAALGARFPAGYAAFMARFGRGITGGLVRVFPPNDILHGSNNVSSWRKRIDEYWFWDESADVLSKAHALESVILGDTVGGDELIFHPSAPDRVIVLAHDFDVAFVASETGLEAAVDWFFTSGKIDEPFEDDSFEPY